MSCGLVSGQDRKAYGEIRSQQHDLCTNVLMNQRHGLSSVYILYIKQISLVWLRVCGGACVSE